MRPTIATRFRCSCPLIDLAKITLMFTTLIPQYLNELVECKIGDFTSPQAFHTIKVQSFNHNRIKLLTKFTRELPVKVFAVVADFPIQAGDLSHTSPPTVRTFLLTTQCLVERPKFVQRLFQRLWVLYLLTRAKGQVSVFHTEVCPNAFTCCRQRSKICVVRCYAYPIASATITLYCNLANRPMPLTVLMKCVRYPIKLPFTRLWIPFTKSQRDTIVMQRPASRTQIRHRLKLMSRLDTRSATKFLEKTIVRIINTHQLLLYRLTRQQLPMRMRCFLQCLYIPKLKHAVLTGRLINGVLNGFTRNPGMLWY